ncbi:MAG: hypothetical protein NVS3B17_18260 [Vulcanimicrobiaceae bacterium]
MRWYARLRRSGEIAFVRKRGRHVALGTLNAYGVSPVGEATLVAITTSKAVGGAVVRNRIRRRVRGALDAMVPPPMKMRMLFVVKPGAARESYERLAADVASAVARLTA